MSDKKLQNIIFMNERDNDSIYEPSESDNESDFKLINNNTGAEGQHYHEKITDSTINSFLKPQIVIRNKKFSKRDYKILSPITNMITKNSHTNEKLIKTLLALSDLFNNHEISEGPEAPY